MSSIRYDYRPISKPNKQSVLSSNVDGSGNVQILKLIK